MFEVTAHIEIREGELEGFKRQVMEIMRQTREKDTRPLRYDWFLSDDGTHCEVREAFEDADALLEHQRYIAPAKMKLFRDFADGHTMTLYARPSPALAGALEAMSVPYTSFSLYQGLEAEVDAPREVPV